MNNDSPLVPQGSLIDQKGPARNRVKIAIFVVLAIHGVGLLAFLMVGCRQNANNDAAQANTNSVPAVVDQQTNVVMPETNVLVVGNNTSNTPMAPVVSNTIPTPIEPQQPIVANPPPAATATDYKIVKGDTLGKIAHANHVSLKALQAANPGVDSSKLKIGQTIHLPAATAPLVGSSAATPTGNPVDSAPGQQIYTVASGNTLTSIAGKYGVTVKSLLAANNRKTTKIRVGQKLKIPAKPGSPSPASAMTNPVGTMETPMVATSSPAISH